MVDNVDLPDYAGQLVAFIAAKEREACAKLLELSTSELLLMAGEITAQELRTVKAVLSCLAARIRAKG